MMGGWGLIWFSGKLVGIDYALLPNCEWNQKQKHKKQPWGNVECFAFGGVIVWLAAWKLVSNDAKRTVAPPNAKHSILLQGCFLCFLFPCPQYLSTEPKKWAAFPFGGNAAVVCFKSRFWGLSVGWCACYFATFTAVPLERRKM